MLRDFFIRLLFLFFGGFGKFLHKVALTVTVQLGLCLIDTKFIGNIIVIDNVIQNRKHRFKEHYNYHYEYCFFHDAKVITEYCLKKLTVKKIKPFIRRHVLYL